MLRCKPGFSCSRECLDAHRASDDDARINVRAGFARRLAVEPSMMRKSVIC